MRHHWGLSTFNFYLQRWFRYKSFTYTGLFFLLQKKVLLLVTHFLLAQFCKINNQPCTTSPGKLKRHQQIECHDCKYRIHLQLQHMKDCISELDALTELYKVRRLSLKTHLNFFFYFFSKDIVQVVLNVRQWKPERSI